MCPSDPEPKTIEVVLDFETVSGVTLNDENAPTVVTHRAPAVMEEVTAEAFLLRKKAETTRADGAASRAQRPSLTPDRGLVIGGKYRLGAPLGGGGMGTVWTARHIDLDVPVAIKLMASTFEESSQQRARFIREARAAARLRSRNVVTVLDYGVDRRTQYIVMELLSGEDLWSRLNRSRAMSAAEILPILDAITNGLTLAHRAGIVHRDLKPENIFLANVAGELCEVVKVLDFGVAKELNPYIDDERTSTGVVIGTPQYMSPEQASGARDIDHRSDLWSLGVILFRALAGRLLFPPMPPIEVLTAVQEAPLPVLSDVAPHLGRHFDPFFARALHRERDARFQSALEMAAAFRQLANGSASGALGSGVGGGEVEASSDGGLAGSPSPSGRVVMSALRSWWRHCFSRA